MSNVPSNPPIPLDGERHKQLRIALEDLAFEDVHILIREDLSINPDHIYSNQMNLTQRIDALIAWADRHGRLEELVVGARRRFPGNPKISAFVKALQQRAPIEPMGIGQPPVSTFDAEAHFRQAVVRRFERLPIRLPSVVHVELALEDIYVDLKVVAAIPEMADTFGPVERRLFAELACATEAERIEKLRQLDDLKYRRWRRSEGVAARFTQPALECAARASRPIVILGDPGSGKSTALQLMALRTARDGCLCDQDSKPRTGPWVPIYLQLAAYDEHLETKKERLTLGDFLAIAWSARRGQADLNALFSDVLRAGRALVLLDGLDEVLTHARRIHVNDQVKALIDTWAPYGNRFVITSRFVGYREAPLSGVADEVSVVDFGPKDIERFLTRWYEATDKPHSAKRSKALLDQINQTLQLRNLAANPLMLSMLATLQSKRGDDERLPERRVELYKDFTEMMLDQRPESRSGGARIDGVPRTDPTKMREHLSDLALWLQLNRPSNTATREDVLGALARSHIKYEATNALQPTPKEKLQSEQGAKQLFGELRDINGLIGERGHDAHGFLHLTYQEFFAGRAVACMSQDDRWVVLGSKLHDPRWREVTLLCAAHLDSAPADELIRRVLDARSEYESILHRDVLLASTIIIEGACASTGVRELIHDKLVVLTHDDIPAVRTRAFSDIASLARLGLEKSIAFFAEALELDLGQLPGNLGAQLYNWVAPLLVISQCRRLLDIVLRQIEDSSADQTRRRQAAMALQSVVRTNNEVRDSLIRLMLREDAAAVQMSIMHCLEGLINEHEVVREAFWILADSRTVSQPALLTLATTCSSPTELRRLLNAHWWRAKDAEIRNALIPAIAKVAPTDREWLVELIKCVSSPNVNTRAQAATHLGAMAISSAEAKQVLLKFIETSDFWSSQGVIQSLLLTIKDDVEVRRAVSAALSRNFSDARESVLLAMDGASFSAEVQKNSARQFLSEEQMRGNNNRSLVEQVIQRNDSHGILCLLDDVRSDWKADRIDTVAPLVTVDENVARDVERCLGDPNPFTRSAAINALAPTLRHRVDLRARVLEHVEDATSFVCHAAMRALAGVVDEDPDVRAGLIRVMTSPDLWKPNTAAESLAKAAGRSDVRAALLQLLQQGDFLGRRGAARVLSALVSRDLEVRERFRNLASDLAAGRVDDDDAWTVLEMLDGVVERDVEVFRTICAQPLSYHRLVLILRHAAALQVDVGDLDSWSENAHQLFNAIVRGMLSWYHTKPNVRRYVLRSIGRAAFFEETLERLMPLISDDSDLRNALVRRGMQGVDNSGADVDVIYHLIPYVKTCPDIESAFRGLFEERAVDTTGYLRQMLAAAGLSGIAGRAPDLQTRLLPWLGARLQHPKATKARKIMAENLGALLTQEDASLSTQVMQMLDSPAWQDRQGAAWMLIHAPGPKSSDLMRGLRGLLDDTRAEESWLMRLQLARLVLNHKEMAIARRALAVAREALGYGKTPWHGPLGDDVRTQAANVLGGIEPTHRDSALIELIVDALKEERSESTRDALYHALLQLVAAAEPPSA